MKIARGRVEEFATEVLLSQLRSGGFVRLDSSSLVRARDGWREGIFVQLSSAPAQELCAAAGVDVPAALEYASEQMPDGFAVAVGGRLSERGINEGDQWLSAETREQAEAAAREFALLLDRQTPWFEQFRSVGDVAAAYYRQAAIEPLGCNDYWKQVFVFNYACLLLAANQRSEATLWLHESVRVIRSEKVLDKDDRKRLQRVTALLATLT